MIKPMMQDRLINPLEGAGDAPDSNIRPALLAEYIGQPVVREQMVSRIPKAQSLAFSSIQAPTISSVTSVLTGGTSLGP